MRCRCCELKHKYLSEGSEVRQVGRIKNLMWAFDSTQGSSFRASHAIITPATPAATLHDTPMQGQQRDRTSEAHR